MKVASDVLAILGEVVIDGTARRLPAQLDANLYARTDKVLQAAGGQWSRKAQAHLFREDPSEVIAQLCRTGKITTVQDLGYFPTPPAVVKQPVELAELQPGLTVLEPSAGHVAIAERVAGAGCVVDCVEPLEEHTQALSDAGFTRTATTSDFLTLEARPHYDKETMNPPFAKGADTTHVTHTHRFLTPDGLLAAVISDRADFHSSPATRDFRALVEQLGGVMEQLPEKAFKNSGTLTSTVVVLLPGSQRRVEHSPAPAAVAMPSKPPAPAKEPRPPTEIAREIVRDLAEAQRHIRALLRDLERLPGTEAKCGEQLVFDLER
ncbi:MAG: hypothetical protein JO362_19440 [Streptomycetaceae bacterium]|nr:hypothetical protein [Streptomycetaceae bacterium]